MSGPDPKSPSVEPIVVEEDGPVRILRLNRPESLNAANAALHARLATIWEEIARDEACRAVVLTGNGRAFCAGGDGEVLKKMNESERYRDATLREGATIVRSMAAFPLPVIAAVNGPAVGRISGGRRGRHHVAGAHEPAQGEGVPVYGRSDSSAGSRRPRVREPRGRRRDVG
jgi:1,4-dihydroxy-2-naphthoyl-CoA synthase